MVQAKEAKEREERSKREVDEEVKEITLSTSTKLGGAGQFQVLKLVLSIECSWISFIAEEPKAAAAGESKRGQAAVTPRLAKDNTTEDIDFTVAIKYVFPGGRAC